MDIELIDIEANNKENSNIKFLLKEQKFGNKIKNINSKKKKFK